MEPTIDDSIIDYSEIRLSNEGKTIRFEMKHKSLGHIKKVISEFAESISQGEMSK